MKTHKFDALSFLAGLVITGIGLAFLLLPDVGDVVSVLTDAGTWFWPVVFIAVGVAILAPLATRDREDDSSGETEHDSVSQPEGKRIVR